MKSHAWRQSLKKYFEWLIPTWRPSWSRKHLVFIVYALFILRCISYQIAPIREWVEWVIESGYPFLLSEDVPIGDQVPAIMFSIGYIVMLVCGYIMLRETSSDPPILNILYLLFFHPLLPLLIPIWLWLKYRGYDPGAGGYEEPLRPHKAVSRPMINDHTSSGHKGVSDNERDPLQTLRNAFHSLQALGYMKHDRNYHVHTGYSDLERNIQEGIRALEKGRDVTGSSISPEQVGKSLMKLWINFALGGWINWMSHCIVPQDHMRLESILSDINAVAMRLTTPVDNGARKEIRKDAATFVVRCPNPNCATQGRVNESRIGSSAKCKKCHTEFTIARPGRNEQLSPFHLPMAAPDTAKVKEASQILQEAENTLSWANDRDYEPNASNRLCAIPEAAVQAIEARKWRESGRGIGFINVFQIRVLGKIISKNQGELREKAISVLLGAFMVPDNNTVEWARMLETAANLIGKEKMADAKTKLETLKQALSGKNGKAVEHALRLLE